MINPAALLCLALLSADFAALTADVTGHWSLEGSVADVPIRLECDFRQADNKVEGVCKADNAEYQIAGAVNDPKFRFSHTAEYQGNTYTLYYSGEFNSETAISGTIDAGGGNTGTFTARKRPPA